MHDRVQNNIFFRDGLPKRTIFIDIETSGNQSASPRNDQIIEIAAVDQFGATVFHKFCKPDTPLGNSKRYIKLSDEMLEKEKSFSEVWPAFLCLATGLHLVFYNADRDIRFFPKDLGENAHISCCMKRFASFYGEYDHYHGSYTYKKLRDAMVYINGTWRGQAHRALADADACRQVWLHMEENESCAAPRGHLTNVIQFAGGT